jgi:hypothetical protein
LKFFSLPVMLIPVMENDPMKEEFKKAAELLMSRGFAKAFLNYDDPERESTFEFTPKGLALRQLLRDLFDIPNKNPEDVDKADLDCLSLVLLLSKDVRD